MQAVPTGGGIAPVIGSTLRNSPAVHTRIVVVVTVDVVEVLEYVVSVDEVVVVAVVGNGVGSAVGAEDGKLVG